MSRNQDGRRNGQRRIANPARFGLLWKDPTPAQQYRELINGGRRLDGDALEKAVEAIQAARPTIDS